MNLSSSIRRQRGVSILEMALAIGLMGLLTVVAMRLMSSQAASAAQRSEKILLERADDSLLAFVVANSRLPNAASPGSGTESTGLTRGVVPWQTVRLPDATAGSVMYELGSSAMAAKSSPVSVLRMSTFKAVNTSHFDADAVGNQKDVILDFCANLGSAISHNSAKVAYSLRRSSSSIEAPGSDAITTLTRSVSDLWTNLHCGELIAVAARAHANAAIAAEMMRYAAEEKLQLANLANGAAEEAVVFAGLDAATSTARMPMKIQDASISCFNLTRLLTSVAAGTADPLEIASVAPVTLACVTGPVDLALHTASVALAANGISLAIGNLRASNGIALAHRVEHAGLAARLSNQISQNATRAVYSGFYLK